MKVYALTGRSGTGKSYKAMDLCRQLKIWAIIDDGLFILNYRVAAGSSAKTAPTKIGATKMALFNDQKIRDEVAAKIKEADPERILIIGTSDKMAERIAARLDLPAISEFIHIEDITTKEERAIARKQRVGQGKHLIPAPSFQLKKQFSGYFMDPLQIIKGFGGGRDSEKSVVRPTYSYKGDYIISDKVIADIVRYIAINSPAVAEVTKVGAYDSPTGIDINVAVEMNTGFDVIQAAARLQERCTARIESMTAFNVDSLNVTITELV
ncbi:MAG: hypothetical protein IKS63_04955 [Firmicutes bacterium]|nr:hypothetical protein [Bacillota bacterium]